MLHEDQKGAEEPLMSPLEDRGKSSHMRPAAMHWRLYHSAPLTSRVARRDLEIDGTHGKGTRILG